MRDEKRLLLNTVIFFLIFISLACSITYTPQARVTQKDEEVERFTIPGTDLEVSYQVSEEGEAVFWLEDQPDLEPLTSRVISEERGALEWNGVRMDGYGELDKEQSDALAELFYTPYGKAVPLIALLRACQTNGDLNAKQLAALLYPWQMRLKYSPVDRVEEARRFWDSSGCADALSQPPNEINEDTPTLIYSSDAPIPVVFGFFPFDPEGAFELKEPPPAGSLRNAEILFISHQLSLPDQALFSSTSSPSIPLNQYGPCGAKCRGACGADCNMNNCKVSQVMICKVDDQGRNTGNQIEVNRYECGVHKGCIDHDACFDDCNSKHGCGTWRAAWCRHSGTLLGLANGCDRKAQRQYGNPQGFSWARGYKGKLGFSSIQFFDYRDNPSLKTVKDLKACPMEVEDEVAEEEGDGEQMVKGTITGTGTIGITFGSGEPLTIIMTFSPAGGEVIGSGTYNGDLIKRYENGVYQGTDCPGTAVIDLTGHYEGGDGGAVNGTLTYSMNSSNCTSLAGNRLEINRTGLWSGHFFANGTGSGTAVTDEAPSGWQISFSAEEFAAAR